MQGSGNGPSTSSIASHGPCVGSVPYPRTAAIAGWSSPAWAWAPRRNRALSAGSPTFSATAPSSDVASNTTAVAPRPSTRTTRYPPMIVPVAMATLTGAVTGRA